MANEDLSPNTKRNRVYLLALFAMFALPLAVAYLLVDVWRPAGSVHHGELLDPARPFSQLAGERLDGGTLDPSFLQGHWTLAFLAPTDCDQACRERIYHIRQIRLALGKDLDRAQTLLLTVEKPANELQSMLDADYPNLTVAIAADETRRFLATAFSTATAAESAAEPWLYLIDPFGNLLMRYGPEVGPRGIIDDLKRLFKYSKIG